MNNENNKYSLVEVKEGTPAEQDLAVIEFCKENGKKIHSVDRVGSHSVYMLEEQIQ